jgi:hypothetical protein
VGDGSRDRGFGADWAARTAAVLLGVALAGLGLPALASAAPSDESRYSLVHGCFALRSEATGKLVAKAGNGYAATAGSVAAAEPFRMQATDLGRYLLYGTQRDFLALSGNDVRRGAEPSNNADWTVRKGSGAFTISNGFRSRALVVGGDGRLTSAPAGSGGGPAARFSFVRASGCPRYPEMTTDVDGRPSTRSPLYGETRGFLEGHMHHMAFRFLGGAHCGRPWHKFGVEYALVDCLDHEPNGCAAVLENVLYGDPARCHDTTGWPDFPDWPHHRSLTHEQSYYKWVERAHQAGMRLFVNLMVQNRVLCEVYPFKGDNDECDDTKTVYIQLREAYRLQDYIDAQAGGPGKGFYRIVRNPFQARKVINRGKMAVVLGMEVSEPFSCRMFGGHATCKRGDINRHLDRLQREGVVQLEITNKFDNALTGVAGDGGEVGTAVNAGNFYATGRFWDLETCETPPGEHDHTPTGVNLPHNDDLILANAVEMLLPGAILPVYPPPPHCNRRGLTALGAHAIDQIIKRGMIFDPDHQSVKGRDQALNLLESRRYSGVISSHSWSTPAASPRIMALGGVMTPSSKDSESFIHKWEHVRSARRGRQFFGFGIGADQNGFASQGGPRGEDARNPVTYPFKSWDGKQTIHRHKSGNRVWDINTDGVAHYGMYADWFEDLRRISGGEIIRDLSRGSEAYLQMWERAVGVPRVRCHNWRGRFTRRGLRHQMRLGAGPRRTLYNASQPVKRGRAWHWCTLKKGSGSRQIGGRRQLVGVFDGSARLGLIVSTLRRHEARGIRRGAPVRALRKVAKRVGRTKLWTRRAGASTFVWGVRKGKVRFTALANRRVAKSDASLRRYLKRAGFRAG